jgi:hypothetical protein
MPDLHDVLAPLTDSPARRPLPMETLARRAHARQLRRRTAIAGATAVAVGVPGVLFATRHNDRQRVAVAPASAGPTAPVVATTSEGVSTDPAPPWAAARLDAADAPAFLQAWSDDPYAKEKCPVLAPDDLGEGRGATARPTDRGKPGGWWVEYDLSGAPGEAEIQRPVVAAGRAVFSVSAVIGTPGNENPVKEADITRWPHIRNWPDGSRAGWGVSGDGRDAPTQPDGTPTQWLAYLELHGSPCLYQVGSYLGEAHLVHLIEHLRRVEGAP